MRTRVAAIINYNNKIVLIKREKGFGTEQRLYYVIPGGGVEEDEVLEEAVKREIMEEIGIEILLRKEKFHLRTKEKNEYFFLADYFSGEVGTGYGPEFTSRDYEKYGNYEVVLVDKENIKNLNLMPPEIKEYIIKNIDKI